MLRLISCSHCDWHRTCGPAELAHMLQQAGMLRRSPNDWELIPELLRARSAELICPQCGQAGLADQPISDDFDDLGPARLCTRCKAVIPPERLEVFPDATKCAQCQDLPETASEAEFCSRCGGLLTTRRSRGAGVTRYQLVCTDCGAKER